MTPLQQLLDLTVWRDSALEPLTGDASARKYFRLRMGSDTAILMDASSIPEIIMPFAVIGVHLKSFGFSVPHVFASSPRNGLMLLEDFGDETFSRKLDNDFDAEEIFTLATDVLIALHKKPESLSVLRTEWRSYHPQKMLEDVELFVDVHEIDASGKEEFRKVWLEVLPLAHQVPASLLLRDYHVGNLMWLPRREGIRRAGLLDFQDAYQGPVTYDLVSLLEDARRDLPVGLKEQMIAHYLAQFPNLDRQAFETSLAILAALRHTRVLAVFEKLSREGKPDYKKLHSPRVERLLQAALRHPTLAGVKQWFDRYARQD
jgi:N-acetylmuramate 1-kinase